MTGPDRAKEAEMAQSIEIQGVQKSGRTGVPFGLLMALMAIAALTVGGALVIRASTTPTVRIAPNPVPQTAPATTGWETAAENAGFTGRLGAASAPVSPVGDGQWVTFAKAAGFTGRLGGVSAPASSSTPDAGGVNLIYKLKAGRA
jgi:hypothetical protein